MRKQSVETKMNKQYYAAESYMGINYTYDSPCWIARAFGSKLERDRWVAENEYNDQGNRVCEAVTRSIAYKIAGIDVYHIAEVDKQTHKLQARPCYHGIAKLSSF